MQEFIDALRAVRARHTGLDTEAMEFAAPADPWPVAYTPLTPVTYRGALMTGSSD